MLLSPTCLSFGLPVSLAYLCVSQTSMDDSGHQGNTGQLLNSRVLGVLKVITLFMTQVSVCQSLSKLHSVHPPPFCRGWGWLSLQPNFKKWGLEGGSTFRGGLLLLWVTFFRGGGWGVQLSQIEI